MAGGTGSSTPFEESYAALTELLGREARRIDEQLAALTTLVGGIGAGVAGSDEPLARARVYEEEEAVRPAPEVRYPVLPRRTTHGGPFGASIIEKVAAGMKERW